jgi:vacuolar-type H+-ATPase subunit I/STV1
MEALGGHLLRQTRTQIEDAYAERAAEVAQRELAGLEAERLAVKTAQTEKARKQVENLQAKIDAAQRKLREKEDELAAKARAVRDEGNKKIALLEAQKTTAVAESKAVLDNRLADLRGEYEERTTRLQEALQRRKAAHATSAA